MSFGLEAIPGGRHLGFGSLILYICKVSTMTIMMEILVSIQSILNPVSFHAVSLAFNTGSHTFLKCS